MVPAGDAAEAAQKGGRRRSPPVELGWLYPASQLIFFHARAKFALLVAGRPSTRFSVKHELRVVTRTNSENFGGPLQIKDSKVPIDEIEAGRL